VKRGAILSPLLARKLERKRENMKSKTWQTKTIIVIGYILVALIIWLNRTNLLNVFFQLDNDIAIHSLLEGLFYTSLIATLIFVLAILIYFMIAPFEAYKIKDKLLCIGLKNDMEITPDLIGKYP